MPRGVTGATRMGLASQGQGAAVRCEAPWGHDMRGAHELSAQALGAVGLRGVAPRGFRVREHFWGILTPF